MVLNHAPVAVVQRHTDRDALLRAITNLLTAAMPIPHAARCTSNHYYRCVHAMLLQACQVWVPLCGWNYWSAWTPLCRLPRRLPIVLQLLPYEQPSRAVLFDVRCNPFLRRAYRHTALRLPSAVCVVLPRTALPVPPAPIPPLLFRRTALAISVPYLPPLLDVYTSGGRAAKEGEDGK